jgi:hypothetical protein
MTLLRTADVSAMNFSLPARLKEKEAARSS